MVGSFSQLQAKIQLLYSRVLVHRLDLIDNIFGRVVEDALHTTLEPVQHLEQVAVRIIGVGLQRITVRDNYRQYPAPVVKCI